MFPANTEEALNQINKKIEKEQTSTTSLTKMKSFLYDFKNGDFVIRDGKLIEVYGKDALKVWIEKIIRTHRFRFKIYKDTEYGVLIEDLIGSTLPWAFVQSELKRELAEAILTNEFIENLTNWEIIRESDYLIIKFTVETVEGAFAMGVSVDGNGARNS